MKKAILSRYDGCPLKRHCGVYALTDICNGTAPDTEKKNKRLRAKFTARLQFNYYNELACIPSYAHRHN